MYLNQAEVKFGLYSYC